jgi:hypothetical protein
MAETINRRYAGRTTALVTVNWFVGEEMDESSIRKPNAGLARFWCERYRLPEGAEIVTARVDVEEWEPTTTGGLLDAEPVVTHEQYGVRDPADGEWEWGAMERKGAS